ncbi:nuclease-related domain-containing protein [Neobacillus sp. PS3-34]|uniref:nuclease-related domain-containing protein n=1 Tax=Neobacillus sp. PS3-34 TaxID=3070678 RepID=UPI0027DEE5FF|nr:nuclease-related domain-containing protein [Neobacillus sp. PS3-34]WML48996.1 nuclease-related domain-containing protein [Neobacillus sp. PS3-34]
MPFKSRTEPEKLKILRVLNSRMNLTADEQKYYLNLEKGYEGEVQFDLLTEKLQSDCLILNDLLLEVNNTKFQIDTLIIYQETTYLFEVKNYEGDFYFDHDILQTISGKEIKNPLDQLKRSNSLLRQLLQNLGFNINVEAYVIFINHEFTLYQTPLNLPIIFPTQLNRFLKKLDTKPSRLNSVHKKLADKLVSLHQTESPPYSRLPPYDYNLLKKGNTCKDCHSFSMFVGGHKIVCSECGCEELVATAVIRSVEELKLLFPDRKITTNGVYDWCRVVESKKRISRILVENYKVNGSCKWTFFE